MMRSPSLMPPVLAVAALAVIAGTVPGAEPVRLKTSRDLDIAGSCVAFSPNGRILAVAPPQGRDGPVTLFDVIKRRTWKTATERPSHRYGGEPKVAFSPDGKLLASAVGSASRGGLALWRVSDGALCAGFDKGGKLLDRFAVGTAFSPDGKFLLTGGDGVHLWAIDGRGALESNPLLTPIHHRPASGSINPVSALVLSPDGKALAAGVLRAGKASRVNAGPPRLSELWQGSLVLYVAAGKQIVGVPLRVPAGTIDDVAFSRDGKLLAVVTNAISSAGPSGRRPAGVKGKAKTKPKAVVGQRSAAVTIWTVPPRGLPSAGAAGASTLSSLLPEVVENANFMIQLFVPEPGNLGEARSLCGLGTMKLSDGLRVEGGLLKYTKLTTLNEYQGRHKLSISFAGKPPANWKREIKNLSFVTYFDKTVLNPVSSFQQSQAIHCSAFAPGTGLLAMGSQDKLVRLWDIRSKQVVAVLEGHTDEVRSLAFSPDGKTLASLGDKLKLWDVSKWTLPEAKR